MKQVKGMLVSTLLVSFIAFPEQA